jgi:histidinol-phosphate aminotransferase
LPRPEKLALSSSAVGSKRSFFRPVIESMDGYVPGEQPRDRRYIKLNTNENPHPPSPRVLEALRAAVTQDLKLYPDPAATDLRNKASEVYGVSPEGIVAGNGSDDLLTMLFRACVEKADGSVAYAVPTYSLYDTLARIQGSEPKTVPYPPDFSLPVDALVGLGARLTIVCSPNSPSGTLTPLATLDDLARRARGLVVVDEAYVDFAKETALSLLSTHPNLVVLRTFSKSFSLAGMRIGLAFTSPDVARELNKVKDSYNLDRLSLVAARAALEDYAWMQANVASVRAAREDLISGLRDLGFRVLPSEANFVFAESPTLGGEDTYLKLRGAGILVRYFSQPELRRGVRITVGTRDENAALLAALRSFSPDRPVDTG